MGLFLLPKTRIFLRGAAAFVASWLPWKRPVAKPQPVQLPGYYVDADWLEAHLRAPELRIVQMGGSQFYHFLHIPNAVLLTKADLVTTRNEVPGLRADTAHLVALFSRLGIGTHTRVVAYDSAGGTEAGRLVWTLKSLGHQHAAVLDGGIGHWLELKKPMTKTPTEVTPTRFIPKQDASVEIPINEVERVARGEKKALLLDVRSYKEYIGDVWRPPLGHISGARHLEWSDTLVDKKDPRLKPREALLAAFAARGLDNPRQEVILYCQTASRAAQTWVLLRHLGFANVRLYDGSIAEWGHLKRPLVTGDHPSPPQAG